MKVPFRPTAEVKFFRVFFRKMERKGLSVKELLFYETPNNYATLPGNGRRNGGGMAMSTYQVVEKFVNINGEADGQESLPLLSRFKGCVFSAKLL